MSTITLITGANQGIGLATATSLARDHGHHVIIGARNAEAGAKVAASLKADGHAASSVQLDVTSQSSIEAAAKAISKELGRIDVLINNAGIGLDGKIPGQTPRELFTQTFNTNVIGTVCVTEAMLPLVRKSEAPRVIFVSSIMGSLKQALIRDTHFFAIDYKAYDASKAAINMIALNYARILEDVHAHVNIVCPGYVASNLTQYTKYGTTPEEGAKRIVEVATAGKDGPHATFSNKDGEIAW